MDVHIAFSVILPEHFPAHVGTETEGGKEKKLTDKELP